MDYKQNRVEDIKRLRDDITNNQGNMVRFLAQAVAELDRMLKSQAKGFALEELYPQSARHFERICGELVYDLNNYPSFRFFEPLLYKSEYYNKASQSIALWATENDDDRPFCLSTPRLNEEQVLHLNIPFDHLGIDALSRMKRTVRLY